MSHITATAIHPGPRPATAPVLCGQQASLQLPTAQILPLLEALQKRLGIDPSNAELALMKFLLAMLTLNTLSGRSLSWITLPGNSIPLTQGPWMFSALDWVEES